MREAGGQRAKGKGLRGKGCRDSGPSFAKATPLRQGYRSYAKATDGTADGAADSKAPEGAFEAKVSSVISGVLNVLVDGWGGGLLVAVGVAEGGIVWFGTGALSRECRTSSG
jgi:hypothetical protein